MKVLLLIDIQIDFLPGGALEISHGDTIIPIVNKLLERFDFVVATQDWHPPDHKSFASNHKDKKPKSFIEYHGLLSVLRYDTPASRVFEGFRERTTTSMIVELSQRVSKREKHDVKSAINALKTISKYNPHSDVRVEDLIGLIEKLKLDRWK